MARLLVRKQRRMLRGWIKWIPVVAIPFGVLFVHAWLNIQILRADYVLRELDNETKELQEQLRHAGVALAVQQAPEVLADRAVEMEFQLPKPGQQELIAYTATELDALPETRAFEVARNAPDQRSSMQLDSISLVKQRVDTDVVVKQIHKEATRVPVPVVTPAAPDTSNVPPAEEVPVANTTASTNQTSEADSEPESAEEPVVLELPEDAYMEELPGLESDMGELEVL